MIYAVWQGGVVAANLRERQDSGNTIGSDGQRGGHCLSGVYNRCFVLTCVKEAKDGMKKSIRFLSIKRDAFKTATPYPLIAAV